jgi:hypothetical protein
MGTTMTHRIPALVLTAVLCVGCGGSSSTDDLSDALLTVGDLAGEWTQSTGDPEAPEGTIPASGIVPDELRAMLPTFDLCPAASEAGKEAAESIQWQYFRQFDLAAGDPIDPPNDREGHMLFLQQFILSGDSLDLEQLTADLFPALEACLGDIPAGEEGPGTASRARHRRLRCHRDDRPRQIVTESQKDCGPTNRHSRLNT